MPKGLIVIAWLLPPTATKTTNEQGVNPMLRSVIVGAAAAATLTAPWSRALAVIPQCMRDAKPDTAHMRVHPPADPETPGRSISRSTMHVTSVSSNLLARSE